MHQLKKNQHQQRQQKIVLFTVDGPITFLDSTTTYKKMSDKKMSVLKLVSCSNDQYQYV
jgi:MFS superfamily sulfate permease-like transporter